MFAFGGGVFSESREVGADGSDDIVTANRGVDTVTVLLSEGIDG